MHLICALHVNFHFVMLAQKKAQKRKDNIKLYFPSRRETENGALLRISSPLYFNTRDVSMPATALIRK